tara:strand:- start:1058 stop:2848 length:1791 start_codon:yes stop_codon:yes gene_type:complete
MRVSDYIFKRLESYGIKKAYIVTGRGALFLTDGLAKNGSFDVICTHHEQSAGYAAVAEAQLTESPSLCVVSTGCASTNCLTPVLNAWQDNNPVIFISGQNVLNETTHYKKTKLRTYGQQEANIIEMVRPITKFSSMITCAQDVPNHLEEAILKANTGRKGPVWLDIPLDIQSSRIKPENINPKLRPFKESSVTKKTTRNVQEICNALRKSKRPVILIGSGIRSSETESQLKKFVELNQIPLVYSASAVDVYPIGKKLSIGSIGSMGCSRQGAFTIQNADFILVLGNRLSSILTGNDFCKFGRDASIHVVDIDKHEHEKDGVKIDNLVNINLTKFFKLLPAQRLTKNIEIWNTKTQYWKRLFKKMDNFNNSNLVDLYELSNVLSKKIKKDSIVITDSGFIEVILPTNMNFFPKRRAIHPVSQGSMGFALPAVLGSYDFSQPKKEIIVVVGDGSIMMNIQELQTIKHHKINAKIIVINNNIYSIIRRRQNELFRKRTIGTGIEDGVSTPDFDQLSKTFGFKYICSKTSRSLNSSLDKLLSSKSPTILEIYGRHDQAYLEISSTKNSEGKIVRRPLEDQWPFLDRDLFKNEMLIEPIDM